MSGHGIRFNITPELFHRDPQATPYGQRLLSNSIELIDELGIEKFTFKKLALEIDSTEASVYRYFENKHKLLLYLSCWYWEWVYYLLDINLKNIEDPKRRLDITIHNIVNASSESPLTEYINENLLHKVVIKESTKAYHIHNVDEENKEGYFISYKVLVGKVSGIISEMNPSFPYPKMLASNLFEMANNQIYFAEHLPKLTDIKDRKKKYDDLEEAMKYFVYRLLE
ncbi:MAG: TetR/AcrR family transcriptional regulator [Saprospiraceae bacterium]|nr:TetR/AcrR family transcriptional regulator [Saprospiraceae bacterium]